eukprot:TRINITY_DN101134_c0_g1_i1.p1 TRINITY_DN101134_c0_g1~~TRINITY_DN101134_c0_g1_i1.p1  ORF type:complete len:230 (+),score=46.26 TRINITY_DN101134_c0_g1_i1:78-767(+)
MMTPPPLRTTTAPPLSTRRSKAAGLSQEELDALSQRGSRENRSASPVGSPLLSIKKAKAYSYGAGRHSGAFGGLSQQELDRLRIGEGDILEGDADAFFTRQPPAEVGISQHQLDFLCINRDGHATRPVVTEAEAAATGDEDLYTTRRSKAFGKSAAAIVADDDVSTEDDVEENGEEDILLRTKRSRAFSDDEDQTEALGKAETHAVPKQMVAVVATPMRNHGRPTVRSL